MRYSHVIYNSSEKSQSGAVGFGVRCSTEGMPVEILNAMEENEIFSFTEAGPSLTPSALVANPEAIRQIVPTYFFRSIPLPDKSRIYVLGRKIAVGFDYTFYLNGKPGRLGNYVVDSYIFPQPPTAAEFEILLEDPESGSNRFIPSSPVPTTDNLEMREISLGHKPYLPVEGRSFTSRTRIGISQQAIELLFSFILGRKEDKPVLVKTGNLSPTRLMAEVARLVPQQQIGNLTFLTNHTEEGKKRGINIVFINEYYTFEIFKKQWIMLDLENNEKCVSDEATLFRQTVENYVARGDFEAIHKLVGWCMSEMYEKGKAFNKDTQTQLYNYVYNYQAFESNIQRMAKDENLRLTLKDYFVKHPEEKRRFDNSLHKWFNKLDSLNGLWEWMNFVIAVGLSDNAIDCSNVITSYKGRITSEIFSDEKSFMEFYRRFKSRFNVALKFIDSNAFPDHNEFLSSYGSDWEDLYALFLADKRHDHEYLVERMVNDGLDSKVMSRIVSKEFKSPEEYISTLFKILKKRDPKTETKIAKMLFKSIRDRDDVKVDFFRVFADKIGDWRYTDLFMWQLSNQSKAVNMRREDVINLYTSIMSFLKNDSAMLWVSQNEGKQTFVKLYQSLKSLLKNKELSYQEAYDICTDIYKSGYSQGISTVPFENLSIVVTNGKVTNTKRINEIWKLAVELNKIDYLRSLVYDYSTYLDEENPKGIGDFTTIVLDNNVMSREALANFAKDRTYRDYYYYAIIQYEKFKAQEKLDYLMNEIGMTEEVALNYLEKYFPKSYEKIMKSREPSIVSKIGGFFKNVFSKKEIDPANSQEDNSTSAESRSPKKKKGKF